MDQPLPPHIDLHCYSIGRRTPEFIARDIMIQLIVLVREVHSAGVFHADIKCSNILLSHKMLLQRKIHLIDFGSARPLHDGQYAGRTGQLLCGIG